MSKVKSFLRFDLDTQEGRDAHFRACKADQAYRALHEIEEDIFRRYDRYGLSDEMKKMTKEKLISHLRKLVHETIIENGIDLSEEYR